ncbi:MAG: hypothetical protein PVH68_21265, partial [Armatimonadota bacterium]
MKIVVWIALSILMSSAMAQDALKVGDAPLAIPTFHCLGLYWSPQGGSADREVTVRYRPEGGREWREALPMRYNPIPETDEDLAEYRGSIVNLDPGTAYEIELRLEGTDVLQRITASTWSEEFPIGKTISLPEVSHEKLVIEESGSP